LNGKNVVRYFLVVTGTLSYIPLDPFCLISIQNTPRKPSDGSLSCQQMNKHTETRKLNVQALEVMKPETESVTQLLDKTSIFHCKNSFTRKSNEKMRTLHYQLE